MDPDVEDFLAHYGKKGMKWGVTKNPGGSVKAARKEGRAQIRANFKDMHKKTGSDGNRKVSVGKTAGSLVLGNATWGASTGYQIARSTGYKKGSSVAIGMLGGPFGALALSEVAVRRAANASVRD